MAECIICGAESAPVLLDENGICWTCSQEDIGAK